MQSEINIKIGENIRNRRMAINMPLEELAKLLELTPGFLGLVERGHRGISTKILLKIVNVLNITMDELFNGVDKTTISPLKDRINSYLTCLDESDCNLILDVCKHLKSKHMTNPQPCGEQDDELFDDAEAYE